MATPTCPEYLLSTERTAVSRLRVALGFWPGTLLESVDRGESSLPSALCAPVGFGFALGAAESVAAEAEAELVDPAWFEDPKRSLSIVQPVSTKAEIAATDTNARPRMRRR